MPEIEPLTIEVDKKTAVIKFVRPEIKNPLSINTLRSLRNSFKQLDADRVIEKIVFTGSGDTFAAGANLNEVAVLNQKTAREFGLRGQNLMQMIYQSKKLTIAAIEGFCMGGALDLALSCKRRVASADSYFAHPGAKLGIITGWGGTRLLPELIGQKKALEMFLTARIINSSEAFEMGLIDEISENPLAKILKTF